MGLQKTNSRDTKAPRLTPLAAPITRLCRRLGRGQAFLPLDLGDQEDAQHADLRIDWVSIPRMREHAVVDQRVGEQQKEEEPCSRPALAEGSSKAPEAKDGGRQEQRILDLGKLWDIRQPRRSCPVVDQPFNVQAEKA